MWGRREGSNGKVGRVDDFTVYIIVSAVKSSYIPLFHCDPRFDPNIVLTVETGEIYKPQWVDEGCEALIRVGRHRTASTKIVSHNLSVGVDGDEEIGGIVGVVAGVTSGTAA
jgi:hypothetical protein